MPAKYKALSLGLKCPKCSITGESLSLNLDSLVIACSECSEEFTADEAARETHAIAERWELVAAWVGQAPTV